MKCFHFLPAADLASLLRLLLSAQQAEPKTPVVCNLVGVVVHDA
jgi:hypothetical protein